MALTQSNKAPGELLRSSDWNELLTETKRLDTDKVSTSGGTIGGNLQVGALAVGTSQFRGALSVSSGGNVQAFFQNTANNDSARVSLNANGNEWTLAVVGPGNRAAGTFSLFSAAAGRDVLSLLPSGNVGIGVGRPTAPLQIAGGNWDLNSTDGDLKIGNDAQQFKIGVALGGGGAGDVRIRAMGGTKNLMLGSGASDLLSIREGSGVGIPSASLNFGAQTRQMINLWNTDYGIGVQGNTAYFRSSKNFAWYTNGAHNDSELNPGGGTLAMRLTNSNLAVSGAVAVGGRINADGAIFAGEAINAGGAISAGNSDIYFTKTDHNHTGIGNTPGWAAIENTSSHNALMIIGRQQPGLRIIKMWDYLEMFGRALKPGGGPWEVLSDERLKQDVTPLSGALDRLLRVQGVSFDWRDPAGLPVKPGRQIGVVAQQVEQAFPEWINTTPDGYKTVEMTGFEALTVEALRELQQQIDALRQAMGGNDARTT